MNKLHFVLIVYFGITYGIVSIDIDCQKSLRCLRLESGLLVGGGGASGGSWREGFRGLHWEDKGWMCGSEAGGGHSGEQERRLQLAKL